MRNDIPLVINDAAFFKRGRHPELEERARQRADSLLSRAALAIKSSRTGQLTVRDIYWCMRDRFPGEYDGAPTRWRCDIARHLKRCEAFEKIEVQKKSGKLVMWRMRDGRQAEAKEVLSNNDEKNNEDEEMMKKGVLSMN